ncbi:MAG TPA: CotH kinase family protein, partial [Thermotogota bacterium]|nr:CotH kinase family protein [Thermotogota bacterium]
MVKKRGKKFIRLFNIVLLLGGLTLAVIVFPSSQSSRKTASTDYTDFLFSGTTPLTVDIIVDEADWEEMLENAQQEAYIPCEVIINGKSVRWVGIRPKGNSSLNMVLSDEESDRFSFKIEFDQYIEGQTFLGLDKLALNNVLGDATYMKEYLSYALMKEMGVPTPLFQYADIRVNGEPWGFYLAVEALEDAFLDRVYGEGHGTLYKPENMGGFGGDMRKEPEPGQAPFGFDVKPGGSTNNGA